MQICTQMGALHKTYIIYCTTETKTTQIFGELQFTSPCKSGVNADGNGTNISILSNLKSHRWCLAKACAEV